MSFLSLSAILLVLGVFFGKFFIFKFNKFSLFS